MILEEMELYAHDSVPDYIVENQKGLLTEDRITGKARRGMNF